MSCQLGCACASSAKKRDFEKISLLFLTLLFLQLFKTRFFALSRHASNATSFCMAAFVYHVSLAQVILALNSWFPGILSSANTVPMEVKHVPAGDDCDFV